MRHIQCVCIYKYIHIPGIITPRGSDSVHPGCDLGILTLKSSPRLQVQPS